MSKYLFVLSMLCTQLAAQPAKLQLVVPEGHAYNTFVSQDPAGFIWISSLEGWYKYDGQTLVQYLIENEKDTTSYSQIIQSQMFDDGRGGLWFSTYDGLHRFEYDTEAFQSTRLRDLSGFVKTKYHPFYIHKNKLWLYAGEHIWQYDVQTKKYLAIPFALHGRANTVYAFPDGQPRFIVGCPWNEADGIELLYRETPEAAWKLHRPADREGLDLPEVRAAVFSSGDLLYLATERGLASYCISTDTYTGLRLPLGLKKQGMGFSSLLIDKKHHQLIASQIEVGIWTFDLDADGRIIPGSHQLDTSITDAHQLFLDRNGRLWRSRNGIGVEYVYRDPSPIQSMELPGSSVALADIHQDKNGTIRLLSRAGQLWELQQKERALHLLSPAAISGGRFKHIGTDTRNIYLCGEEQLGCLPYSSPGEVRYFPLPTTRKRTLAVHESGALLTLERRAINQAAIRGDTVQLKLQPETSGQRFAEFDYLTYLGDGILAAAYLSDELWLFDWNPPQLSLRSKVPIGSDITYVTKHVKPNSYWVGTRNGLFLVDGTQLLTALPSVPQMSSLHVRSLLPYPPDRVLIGTDKGLLVFNHKEKGYLYFSEEDGLRNASFVNSSGAIDIDGYCWMATEDRAVFFQPDSLQHNSEAIYPYATALWVNNVPYKSDSSMVYRNTLELGYRKNTLYFQLSSIGFQQADRTSIRYRMLGGDTTWITIDAGGFARFPKLSPGHYTLEMEAINRNGLPAGRRSLEIHISPPFWQTWWFRALIVFTLLAGILATYLLLLRREINKQKELIAQQARISAERDRIAGEVHDDLGGQLSSIFYLSEELLLNQSDHSPLEVELRRINELSRHSMQNIRDIIFALDNRRNSLSDLTTQLERAGRPLFADRKIRFHCQRDISHPDLELSSRQKRNLSLIVKEAFHNIIKHAEASEVNLSVREEDGRILIAVQDNGKGFQVADQNGPAAGTGGYGLENMRNKAKAIGAGIQILSSEKKGTTIQINWTKNSNP